MTRYTFIPIAIVALACRTESGSDNLLPASTGADDFSGGQTGGEVGGEDDGVGTVGGSEQCEEEPEDLPDGSAQTSLGFSAEQILEFAAGSHEAALRWNEVEAFTLSGEVPVRVTPESGTTKITVDVTSAGGMRLVRSMPAQSNGSGQGLLGGVATSCRDRLEIDVDVDVTTEGGALAEHFQGVLLADSSWLARLSLPFEIDALSGSLNVDLSNVPNAALKQLSIDMQLGSGDLFTGTVGGIIEQNNGQVASAGPAQLATWGDNPCQTYQTPVPLDAALGEFTPRDMLSSVNDDSPLELTWSDGTHTELSMQVATQALMACSDTFSGQVSLPAELTATTADGRMDSLLVVDLLGTPDGDGGLQDVQTVFNNYFGRAVAPAQFADEFGIEGVDVSGFDSVTISFGTVYDLAGDTPPSGKLEILGLSDAVCPPVPAQPADDEGAGSAPGCAGTEATVVETATW